MTGFPASAARLREPAPIVYAPVGTTLRAKALELTGQLLLVTVVPRVLGPSDYGVFALALAVVTLSSMSMALGGPTLMSRFVPAAAPHDREALARAFVVRLARWRALVLSGAVLGAAVLVAASPSSFPPAIVFLAAAALVLDVAATLAFQAALALGRRTAWNFRFGVQNTVLAAAVVAGHALAGVEGAVAALAIASAVVLLWSAALVGRPLLDAPPGASLPAGAVRFGTVQAVASLFTLMTHRGPIIAVALLAGSSVQTGFSGLAVGIALAATYAVGQLFVVQLPALVEATRHEPDLSLADRSLRHLGSVSLAGTVALAVVGVCLLEWAVPVVFGERFEGAVAATAVALAVLPHAPLTAMATQSAALRLQPGLRAWTTGAGLLAFAVTAALAVPAWEATGGSVALLAGTSVTVVASALAFPGTIERRLLAATLGGSALVLGLALATGAV
jgi:O-antigen/teichoic acid export membrane protein